jgi:hypothetical protein
MKDTIVKLCIIFLLFITIASITVYGQTDSDGDGIPDTFEVKHLLNPNNPFDAAQDFNYNGLTNYQEFLNNSNPWDLDSDNDRLSNYAETTGFFGFFTDVFLRDTDGDGISDLNEISNSIDVDDATMINEIWPENSDRGEVVRNLIARQIRAGYVTDPTNFDTDGDGLMDGDEVLINKTNPTNPDTDRDGLMDGCEVFIYRTNPNDRDSDNDGALDSEEIIGWNNKVTNPLINDTDGDGIFDGEELFGFGFSPIQPSNYLLSYEEFVRGSHGGEYITTKAKVNKITWLPDHSGYWIHLSSPDKSTPIGMETIARTTFDWHFGQGENERTQVCYNTSLNIREGDLLVLVGKSEFKGNTRELVIEDSGSIFLILTLEELRARWIPSMDNVRIVHENIGHRPDVIAPMRPDLGHLAQRDDKVFERNLTDSMMDETAQINITDVDEEQYEGFFGFIRKLINSFMENF